MINVTREWWWAFVIAGAAGMVGGLIYDLILDRLGDSGLIERIAKIEADDKKRKYIDIGTWASVIIGGGAAVGFLYFLGPEVRTVLIEATKDKAASSTTVREYNPFKLIPAGLIVGTGGVSFVKAMRDKLLKLVNETKLDALTGAVTTATEAAVADIATSKVQGADGDVDHAGIATGRLEALGDLAKHLRN